MWLTNLLQWFADHGITVDRCIADFNALSVQDGHCIIWFNQGYVWGNYANGLGFSVAQQLSQSVLKDILVTMKTVFNALSMSTI